MENFYLEETAKTPRIHLSFEDGKLLIQGKSIPENSIEFYKPFFQWLDDYIQQPKEVTTMDVKLQYFNTSSSKCLMEVFRKLEKVKSNGKVEINWYYEEDDEDMLESGQDFRDIIRVPIHMKLLEEE